MVISFVKKYNRLLSVSCRVGDLSLSFSCCVGEFFFCLSVFVCELTFGQLSVGEFSHNECHLLTTFANRLEIDQARHVFPKDFFEKVNFGKNQQNKNFLKK